MSNHINGNLYHYAGNNPVRYVDQEIAAQTATPTSFVLTPTQIDNLGL